MFAIYTRISGLLSDAALKIHSALKMAELKVHQWFSAVSFFNFKRCFIDNRVFVNEVNTLWRQSNFISRL